MKAHLQREYGSVEQVTEALIDQAGGAKRTAIALGKSLSSVYAYADPKADTQMTLGQVAALTRPGQDAAAEFLAILAGGVFVPLPLRTDAALSRDFSALALESGEAMARAVKALGDGTIDAKEAGALLTEIDDVLRVAAQIRGQLTAIREGEL